jgi:hypothetical protein
MKTVTGMEEVLAHERAIRCHLAVAAKGDREARAIMGGKFPATGTRLDALKEISKRLKLAVDV